MVTALLTALATLEDLTRVGSDAHMALNALEGIAAGLGRMDSGARLEFLETLERTASHEPARAAWIRGLPDALGLAPAPRSGMDGNTG